jgi:outer membrane protein OmpA-like peptidoglycan-associated protein
MDNYQGVMQMKRIKNFILFSFMFSLSVFAQDQLKVYQNYDFVPGDKILFEDDFSNTRDGEFPAMWKIFAGQGVVNKIDGKSVFIITEGNYAIMGPRIKTATYLDKAFTIECDYYTEKDDDFGIVIAMPPSEEFNLCGIHADNVGTIKTHYMENVGLEGTNPDADKFEYKKWRHLAIAYKDGQMKCYIDQNRILVIPQTEYQPKFVRIIGTAPIRFTNFRIALGGGMNMLDQLYRDGRIVTRGILFDVGKATIKPQSMGVINEIVKMLKQDAKVKLSIEGHTDSDGDDKLNMTLSQQRADAVKKAIVDQGIESARLTTKGLGETKPVDSNSTPEGKANNRRVEFVLVN